MARGGNTTLELPMLALQGGSSTSAAYPTSEGALEKFLELANFHYAGSFDFDYYQTCGCSRKDYGDDFDGCNGPPCSNRVLRDLALVKAELTSENVIYNIYRNQWPQRKKDWDDGKHLTPLDLFCLKSHLDENGIVKTITVDDWYVGVDHGYYGEEIGDVTLEGPIIKELAQVIGNYWSLSATERLYQALFAQGLTNPEEYNWNVEKIPVKKINFTPLPHTDTSLAIPIQPTPMCICLKVDSEYSLVSGAEELTAEISHFAQYGAQQSSAKNPVHKVVALLGRSK